MNCTPNRNKHTLSAKTVAEIIHSLQKIKYEIYFWKILLILLNFILMISFLFIPIVCLLFFYLPVVRPYCTRQTLTLSGFIFGISIYLRNEWVKKQLINAYEQQQLLIELSTRI